jgi:hypothetical protein
MKSRRRIARPRLHREAITAGICNCRKEVQRSICAEKSQPSMSQMGQSEKNSVRVYVFRFAPEIGHCSTQAALRFCAQKRTLAVARPWGRFFSSDRALLDLSRSGPDLQPRQLRDLLRQFERRIRQCFAVQFHRLLMPVSDFRVIECVDDAVDSIKVS